MKQLLTAAEVGKMLGVPTTWVYAEARAERIPHIRLGRYRRFALDSITSTTRSAFLFTETASWASSRKTLIVKNAASSFWWSRIVRRCETLGGCLA
jgi:excisionase family DNA binding protein